MSLTEERMSRVDPEYDRASALLKKLLVDKLSLTSDEAEELMDIKTIYDDCGSSGETCTPGLCRFCVNRGWVIDYGYDDLCDLFDTFFNHNPHRRSGGDIMDGPVRVIDRN